MSMKYIADFTINHFEEIWNDFSVNTVQYIIENKTEIFQKLKKQIEDFIAVIVNIQKSIPIRVSTIQMSVLFTSIAENKPVIRYEAFGEKGILGDPFISKEENCSWMFTEWEGFGKKLEEEVKNLNLINFISDEQIWQLKFKNMMALICGVVYIFKYDFIEMNQFDSFQKMLVTKPFQLTFGAYRDWQKVLYGLKDEVDIFLQPDMKKLRFQNFYQIIYTNKTIEDRLFNHSTFKECKFKDVIIKESDLSDCLFENCSFENVTFINCKARGINFNNCNISKSNFKEIDFSNGFYIHGEELLDIYRNSQMITCNLTKVDIENCNMKGIIVLDCQNKNVEIDDKSILLDSQGTESWRASS